MSLNKLMKIARQGKKDTLPEKCHDCKHFDEPDKYAPQGWCVQGNKHYSIVFLKKCLKNF